MNEYNVLYIIMQNMVASVNRGRGLRLADLYVICQAAGK